MSDYFNINYELSPSCALERIDNAVNGRNESQFTGEKADYVCVADGNILQMVHRNQDYRAVVNGGLFSICDSSWVPVFLKWIYGIRVPQYCGSQIFDDILSLNRYRMYFLGTSRSVLDSLKERLASEYDGEIASMEFVDLPFCNVDEFDYPSIARAINQDHPQIIWVALGAPKQELFMSRLKPLLDDGVMIAVGAVFKFYSSISEKRAPQWMIRHHLEFMYRIFSEPGKQISRCWSIITALPSVLLTEWRRKQTK